MTINELTHAIEIHTAARNAAYARFLVEGNKTILIEVAHHAAIIVELVARITILER